MTRGQERMEGGTERKGRKEGRGDFTSKICRIRDNEGFRKNIKENNSSCGLVIRCLLRLLC
jgi:hypothetical protein